MADEQKPKNKGGRPKGYKMTEEQKAKLQAGWEKAKAEGRIGRPKGFKVSEESKNKTSNTARAKVGRPARTPEQRAEEIAEYEAKKNAKEKVLKLERKAELAAQIIAHEQALDEMQREYPKLAEARAKWQIDTDKLRTHNQYITAIAMMPNIDPSDPVQVQNRLQDYLDIAAAAGQRIVFETCALALGLSRLQLRSRLNGQVRMSQDLQNAYAKVRAILDTATAEYAHSGEANAISTIFFARNNQGYTNDDPKNVVENTETGAEQTNDEIRRKYGDLPL